MTKAHNFIKFMNVAYGKFPDAQSFYESFAQLSDERFDEMVRLSSD